MRYLYFAVGPDWAEERMVKLDNETVEGQLRYVNYPLEPPMNLRFIQRLSAPLGQTIHIEISPPRDSKRNYYSY